MAEATAKAPAAGKKNIISALLIPLAMLVLGAALGAAGGLLAPLYLPAAAKSADSKPPVPQNLPLEYIELDNSFTANLKDSGRFVQLRIAISTHGGKAVSEAMERHRVAVVAAILDTLSDTNETDLDESGGRDVLARRIRLVINDVLRHNSGITGIEDVFFTSFVMQ